MRKDMVLKSGSPNGLKPDTYKSSHGSEIIDVKLINLPEENNMNKSMTRTPDQNNRLMPTKPYEAELAVRTCVKTGYYKREFQDRVSYCTLNPDKCVFKSDKYISIPVLPPKSGYKEFNICMLR